MAGIITPIGTLLCYGPTLFEARRSKFNPTQDPRFEGHLVFTPAAQATPEYKALRAALMECATNKWGAKMQDKAFVSRLKFPLKDHTKGADGEKTIKAWSKTRPGIVGPSLQEITVPSDVFSGQLARFEVAPWAYDQSGSVGVTLFLNNVQITKFDMPRLDGRASADKVFGKVENEAGDDSSTAGDDDLPF